MVIPEKVSRHTEKVQQIALMVKKFAENAKPGEYFSLKKASVSHMVPQPDNPRINDRKINVTDLTEIIDIDPLTHTCVAESGVTFSQLVNETLKLNLVPMCVSELKTITIGGAVAGCSIESMSFKYGGFFDSCTELEIISGTGEIIRCSKTEKPEIFEMIHGSFGTLGILTLLKFKLVRAKPYVRTDYITYPSFHLLMEAIREHQKNQDIEMMDAIVHAPDKCVLVVASFVDSAPYTHTYVWNIFYKSTLERKHDYMSTYEYFFRYDTECHWCTRNLGLENKALRTLLGPFVLGSSNILHLAEKFPNFVKKANPPDVTVDVFIPESKVEEFWSWYLKTFNYFPLWIVPYYIPKVYPWINPNHVKGLPNTFFIDCAIYAFQQKDTSKNYYKLLEDKVFELQGIKTLITHNYYDEKTFWSWLNKENYEKVKQIVDPKNLLRELYAKTNYKSRQ